jgi:hypothetical protein
VDKGFREKIGVKEVMKLVKEIVCLWIVYFFWMGAGYYLVVESGSRYRFKEMPNNSCPVGMTYTTWEKKYVCKEITAWVEEGK